MFKMKFGRDFFFEKLLNDVMDKNLKISSKYVHLNTRLKNTLRIFFSGIFSFQIDRYFMLLIKTSLKFISNSFSHIKHFLK